mgnify:CR=1 FL=1
MTRKKVILLVVAALFAVSGLTALPSGNVTGGVGCILIAAVCAYFGVKKKEAEEEEQKKNASARRCIWQNFRDNQNKSSRRDVQ